MKFIRDLIKNKNWSDDPEAADFNADNLRRDFAQEGGYDSPLVGRQSQQAMDFDDDDEWLDDDLDLTFDAPKASAQADIATDALENASKSEPNDFMASMNEPANGGAVSAFDAADMDEFDEDEFDEIEERDWNIGLAPEDDVDHSMDFQFEPDFEDGEDMNMFADPLFQDEGSAREIEQAAMDAVHEQEDLSEREKQALQEEIRRAMHAVRHIRSDDEINRQVAAREQLGMGVDAAHDDRILDETNEVMDEDNGSRRRQAIALMKAAALATKSDPNLRKLAGRDSALDTDEQSDYRQDLESFDPPGLQSVRSRSSVDHLQVHNETMPEADSEMVIAHEMDDAHTMTEEPKHVAPQQQAKENPGLNDLPVLDRPAKVQSEILRLQAKPEMKRDEGTTATESLRSALLKASAQKAAAQQDADLHADEVYDEEDNAAQAEIAQAVKGAAINIWDIDADSDDAHTGSVGQPETPSEISAAASEPTPFVQVPPPAQGRSGRQAGRVKTRLLGFTHDEDTEDPFAKDAKPSNALAGKFPVGWIVITDGPGRGNSFALSSGVTQIGRGEGQGIRLDFGDLAISRENHAAIAYDMEKNTFFLGHGGKSNLVRLNSSPVLSTENLASGDKIRIGETTLRFVAFCDEGFDWSGKGDAHDAQRAFG